MEQVIKLFSYIRRSPREFFIWLFLSFFIIFSILLLLRLNGIIVKFPFIDDYLVFVKDNSDDGKYLCIEGKYKYRCNSTIKNHGGVCEISIIETNNGRQWKLNGQRMWEQLKDSTGSIFKEVTLEGSYNWQTFWGDYISDNRIAFRYEITNSRGRRLLGYAEGVVHENANSVNIVGDYWQLPPEEPLYGTFEFIRQQDDRDVAW